MPEITLEEYELMNRILSDTRTDGGKQITDSRPIFFQNR